MWVHTILGILKGNSSTKRPTCLSFKRDTLVPEEWSLYPKWTKSTISWRRIINTYWLYIRYNIIFQCFMTSKWVSTTLITIGRSRYCGTNQSHTPLNEFNWRHNIVWLSPSLHYNSCFLMNAPFNPITSFAPSLSSCIVVVSQRLQRVTCPCIKYECRVLIWFLSAGRHPTILFWWAYDQKSEHGVHPVDLG